MLIFGHKLMEYYHSILVLVMICTTSHTAIWIHPMLFTLFTFLHSAISTVSACLFFPGFFCSFLCSHLSQFYSHNCPTQAIQQYQNNGSTFHCQFISPTLLNKNVAQMSTHKNPTVCLAQICLLGTLGTP